MGALGFTFALGPGATTAASSRWRVTAACWALASGLCLTAPAAQEYPAFDPTGADAETECVAAQATQVSLGDDPTSGLIAEAHELRLRLAHSLLISRTVKCRARAGADDPGRRIPRRRARAIEITYLGPGQVTDRLPDTEEGPPPDPAAIPARYLGRDLWLVGFNGDTRSQFEVRIPSRFARSMVRDARARRVDLGTPPGGEGPLRVPESTVGHPANRGGAPVHLANGITRGITGDQDTRVLFGLLNTAQTYPNWSRLVSFVPSSSVGDADAESICSGTLVGPHHVVSAAHCIYRRGQNGGSWIQPALRVGRNGTGWITDADTSVPSRWFWVEAAYKSAADNNSSLKEWDFGLIMPWDRNIGGPVGWFGWMYSNTSHDDMYNRGYPHCSPDGAPPPANCQPGHLYGDLNLCRTDYFSSDKDSSGYRLLGYHSCDTSGGQSGSSLYRFWPERNAWVVRGVHKGATHHATNDDDFDPNQSFALVTRDRSAWISYFRSAYP